MPARCEPSCTGDTRAKQGCREAAGADRDMIQVDQPVRMPVLSEPSGRRVSSLAIAAAVCGWSPVIMSSADTGLAEGSDGREEIPGGWDLS